MGPHFFKCGKRSGTNASSVTGFGFNGAALFQVRKVQVIREQGFRAASLQWGRTFSSAERSDTFFRPLYDRLRFNGAALFQVRKALAQPGRPTPFYLLQWGRTFSSAER